MHYAIMASFLALITGALLWLASVFRLGWITQFISRGVTAGFISGAAILILVGQIKYVTGIAISGNSLLENVETFLFHRRELHVPTLMVGVAAFTGQVKFAVEGFGQFTHQFLGPVGF